MKIGIITYHAVYNFGANLQILSTVSYLKNKGHDPRVINWMPVDLENKYDKGTPNEQVKVHKDFQEKYLPLTKRCENSKEIAECVIEENIEAIIIGSDSLFNLMKPKFNWFKLRTIYPSSDHVFPNPFFGDFFKYIPNIPIAGLSISSQNSRYWDFKKHKKIIGNHLNKFKYLSVRDNWTQDLVSYYTDSDVVPNITPDPVFSFNSNIPIIKTKKEILEVFKLPSDYFLISFTGGKRASVKKQWINDFVKESELNGIQCVQLTRTTGGQELNLKYKIERPLSPIDWYYLIKYSKGFVGVLMHPIVTAMHNSVPFFSFDHYGVKRGINLNKESSKTYHIIKKSGFQKQHFSLDFFKPFPNASKVVDGLVSFDKEKCKEFSVNQEIEYNANMEKILNSFSKK